MMSGAYRGIRLVFILSTMLVLLLKHCLSGDLISLGLIASGTVGLAHGSLDWPLAKFWGLRPRLSKSLVFVLLYLLPVALLLILWQIAPLGSLCIFLFFSFTHFASDWREELPPLLRYLMGVMVISLPALHFSTELDQIFALLCSSAEAAKLSKILFEFGLLSTLILGLFMGYWAWTKKHLGMVLEWLFLILAALYLNPIVYFSLYFCCLHAAKHWHRMHKIGLYQALTKGIRLALWPTLVVVFSGLFILFYMNQHKGLDQSLCKTVFIGLAALTVPHWILLEIYGRLARVVARNQAG